MMFGLRGLQLFPLSVEMHDSLMAICQVPKAKFQMENIIVLCRPYSAMVSVFLVDP